MEALKGESKYPHINEAYVKEDEVKEMCDRHFTSGIQGKFYYMIQWMQCINFLAGNQWITYNIVKKEFEIDPNLREEERVTFNKILPAYRMAVGSLLRDRQKAKVLQVNDDEQSIDASKVATKLLDHVRRISDGVNTQKEAIEWAAITGKGVMKKWFDPDRNQIVDEVLQTFEFIVPGNVRKLSKMPWVCHARFETTDWLWEQYGVDLDADTKGKDSKMKETGSSEIGQYGSFLAAVKNIMEDGQFTGTGTGLVHNNILVKEFWYRPSKKYKKGLLVIMVGNEVLYADKNPISKDDEEFYFPFNEMNWFDLPFRYWPMGLIEPVIGLQAYHNKFQSYGLENFKYAGAPVVIGQEGAVNQDEWVMEPGAYLPYNGNAAPTIVTPNPISPQMFEVITQLDSGISEIVGILQFGRGMMPPGVHAAAAMAIMNEQDQIRRMTLTVNLETFLRTDAKQTLYLVRKFWPAKQKIRVLGEENRWEVIDFDKSVLTGEEEIEIESKQELAQDKMTRFNQILELMKTPKVDNPNEPIMNTNDGLRLMELESTMSTVSIRNLNWNMAKDENMQLKKGKRVLALAYEDHQTHIEAHLQYMLRIEFKELDMKVQGDFQEHYDQHMKMMNGAQQDAGAQASQDPQSQQPMMGQPIPGQMPMQPQMIPQHQMPMQMQQPPMQQPMAPPTMVGGIPSGLQGGMQNVLNQAVAIPGGR